MSRHFFRATAMDKKTHRTFVVRGESVRDAENKLWVRGYGNPKVTGIANWNLNVISYQGASVIAIISFFYGCAICFFLFNALTATVSS